MSEFNFDGPAHHACFVEIAINPNLREGFDNTPNADRPPEEIEQWWGRPYIVTTTWEQQRADATYDEFIARMGSYGDIDWTPPTSDEWLAQHEQHRKNWFEWFPNGGTRYEVRCLDGGAWDRATCWGVFPNLEAAIQCAKSQDIRLVIDQ